NTFGESVFSSFGPRVNMINHLGLVLNRDTPRPAPTQLLRMLNVRRNATIEGRRERSRARGTRMARWNVDENIERGGDLGLATLLSSGGEERDFHESLKRAIQPKPVQRNRRVQSRAP